MKFETSFSRHSQMVFLWAMRRSISEGEDGVNYPKVQKFAKNSQFKCPLRNKKCQINQNEELYSMGITHRVISDRVHRLLVTLSYFRPDRFVQLLSLIPILILLLYYLVSGCLTSLC